MTAPRLRGSVTPSSITISGGSPRSSAQREQVVGVGVLVGVELGRDALVHGAAGELVELDPPDLHQGDVLVGGEPEDLADAVVAVDALGDVERR